jgi:hypothetical protein
MESEGNPVLTEIFEPCHHFPDGLYAHDRGSFLRTPAITAFGRTAQGWDEHHVKRIFHYTRFTLLYGIIVFMVPVFYKKRLKPAFFP